MQRRLGRLSDMSLPETPQSKIPRRVTTGGTATPPPPPQDGAERVKVVVRLRPSHPHETAGGVSLDEDGRTICLQRSRNVSVAQTDFRFDKVLGPDATQADVYDAAVKPIVEDVLRGYNGTIMAYGQTGAGKTYTLSSVQSADNIGMMPRAAANLFSEIAADSTHVYNVVMGYVQIYMELIQDLLAPENENLQIREGNNGVFVAGVEEKPVRSMADCLRLMQLGDQNRRVAFTQLNATSSRSHAIVMLTVIKRRRSASQAPEQQKMQVGKLFIVDLAGSERLKKSQSTGQRASEAKAINLSLTTLGICINARADPNAKHVPFRDSKLTRLLQESLGGNAKTSLVIAVANATDHTDETLQSLQFGTRAMHVQTKAVVNESTGGCLLTAELLANLSNLEIQPCHVDASLLAKEEELERIQEALQGEKDKAAKIIAALQAEQDSRQADKERELNAIQETFGRQQAEAERQQNKLLRARAEADALTSQYAADLEQMRQQLQEALQSIEQAEERRLQADRDSLAAQSRLRTQHEAEKEELRRCHRENMQAAELQHNAHVDELREQLSDAAARERQMHEAAEQQKRALQAERLETEARAAAVITEAQDAADARVAASQQITEREAAAASDANCQLDALQRQHAALADDASALTAEVNALRAQTEMLQREGDGARQDLEAVQARLAAVESSNEQYKALYMNNKRLNDAARVIQGRYKAWRMRTLKDQSSRDAQALVLAHRDKNALEGQKAVIERSQHKHLVWAGRSLVAGSLSALEETIQTIRAAFLLPTKELRTLGHVKSRMSMSPAISGSPKSCSISPSPLSRSLSFVSETVGPGLAAGSVGRIDGPSHDGPPCISLAKQPTPTKIAAFSDGIQAHWGTPAR